MNKIPLVHIEELAPLPGFRLWLRFSDNQEGICDLSDFVASGGPMVAPLREEAFFKRAFVEMGVPTWPNGFDLDAINLYMEMKRAGSLKPGAAA